MLDSNLCCKLFNEMIEILFFLNETWIIKCGLYQFEMFARI